MLIIDTHTHVAVKSLLSRTVSAVDRDMPILPVEDLIEQMDAHGVAHALLVQWGSSWDHHYVARCMADYPGRFAVVTHIDMQRHDAISVLHDFVKLHGFKGVRYSTTDRSPGDNPMQMWEQAANCGAVISASAGTAQQFADGLEPVLKHLPDLVMRIEHLGRCPHKTGYPDTHFDRLLKLATYPNVHINIDGFLQHDYPDHFKFSTYPFEAYQPFIRQVIDTFGPQRCMWGSEFPFLNNPYDIGIRYLNEICDFLTDDDRRWIMGKTASQLWGLGP
jgi:predicted TIM-barrel fold metal-dependent hydrolase